MPVQPRCELYGQINISMNTLAFILKGCLRTCTILNTTKLSVKPVLVAVVHRITWDGAELFPITAQHLWAEDIFVATTVTQRLHHSVNLCLEHLRQLKVNK